MQLEAPVDSVLPESNIMPSFDIDPSSISDDFPPLISPEDEAIIEKFFLQHPELRATPTDEIERHIPDYTIGTDSFDHNEPWCQTFSGKRFTPLNPNPDAIVLQDIARGLSMQCRFNGQVKSFYSVAQHSVLVSYICDMQDALWGLLHDASEAYICDFSAPLKYSGKFENYREVEAKLMNAICRRFNLDPKEPASVKRADKLVLATEGRDLLAVRRNDWFRGEELPFKISPLSPAEAEALFVNRFYNLINLKNDEPVLQIKSPLPGFTITK